MKIPENKQSRLRHYIAAPKRFLRKARDFYVDSMMSIDGNFAAATHISNLPENFDRSSCRMNQDDNERLEELFRSISRKYKWRRAECGGGGREEVVGGGGGAMERSYSVALGKIGTIDEDEACEFEEDVGVFARSRSHAFVRKNVFYY